MEAQDIIYIHYRHLWPRVGYSCRGSVIRNTSVADNNPEGYTTIVTSPVTDIQIENDRTVITTQSNSRYEVVLDTEGFEDE